MTPVQQVSGQRQVPGSTSGAPTSAGIAGLLRKAAHPAVLLNVVAPFAAYQVLTALGASEVAALSVASLFPLAAVLTSARRARRLDWIGVASVAAIALGLVSGLVLHDPRLLLVKDSLVTGGLGLGFLGSLAAPRPLIFVFAREFTTAGNPATSQELDQRWLRSAGFRTRMRQMTVVWGLAMLAEATLRAGLAFLVAPAVLLAISPLLSAAVFGPLAGWTIYRRRRAGQQDQAEGQDPTRASRGSQR